MSSDAHQEGQEFVYTSRFWFYEVWELWYEYTKDDRVWLEYVSNGDHHPYVDVYSKNRGAIYDTLRDYGHLEGPVPEDAIYEVPVDEEEVSSSDEYSSS